MLLILLPGHFAKCKVNYLLINNSTVKHFTNANFHEICFCLRQKFTRCIDIIIFLQDRNCQEASHKISKNLYLMKISHFTVYQLFIVILTLFLYTSVTKNEKGT